MTEGGRARSGARSRVSGGTSSPEVPDSVQGAMGSKVGHMLGGVVEEDRGRPGPHGAIRHGEDHYGVIERVQGLDLRGRPWLCRDAALRCLAEAGRCRRLVRRLRGEAARWLGKAREEVEKGMKR